MRSYTKKRNIGAASGSIYLSVERDSATHRTQHSVQRHQTYSDTASQGELEGMHGAGTRVQTVHQSDAGRPPDPSASQKQSHLLPVVLHFALEKQVSISEQFTSSFSRDRALSLIFYNI